MEEKKPLVILAAVGLELAPLRRTLGAMEAVPTAKPLRLERFQSSAGTVYLGRTGMGPRSARKAIEILLATVQPRAILSVGLVGALDATLRIGDLIIGEINQSLSQLDPPVLHREVHSLGQAQQHARLRELLQNHGLRFMSGTVVTSPKVIETALLKRQISGLNGTSTAKLGVEMETAGLIEGLALYQDIPLLSLRSVSDLASEDLAVDFDQFHTLSGTIKPWGFLRYFFRHPEKAANLVRLVRHSKQAAENLGKALSLVLQHQEPLGI